MSRVDAAAPIDRLPWLPDEPNPPARRASQSGLLLLAGGLTVAVAAAGFWIGTRSEDDQQLRAPVHSGGPTTTVRLPEPRAVVPEIHHETQPEVRFAAPEQVRPAPPREIRIPTPRTQEPEKREAAPPAPQEQGAPVAKAAAETQTAAAAHPPQPLTAALPKPWQPRVVKGAAGRLVEIGAFGSVQQAKLGWRYMARAYPAMIHLPAVVRPDHNSKGRIFYRFRVGTTSQAHSEVLCQRMVKIHLSCAVVGLPWKAKVER
jgi:hypothetical protein